jgi:hypothetical protein
LPVRGVLFHADVFETATTNKAGFVVYGERRHDVPPSSLQPVLRPGVLARFERATPVFKQAALATTMATTAWVRAWHGRRRGADEIERRCRVALEAPRPLDKDRLMDLVRVREARYRIALPSLR